MAEAFVKISAHETHETTRNKRIALRRKPYLPGDFPREINAIPFFLRLPREIASYFTGVLFRVFRGPNSFLFSLYDHPLIFQLGIMSEVGQQPHLHSAAMQIIKQLGLMITAHLTYRL